MEYNIITDESEALKAVENNGYALRYVKDRAVFDKLLER